MADMFTKASFAFTCTRAELALLVEAFQASEELYFGRGEPESPSAALLASFPPTAPGELWSGFREAFPDPDYPSLGAVVSGDATSHGAVDTGSTSAWIYGETDFQPSAVAEVVRRCCAETLAQGPIGFEWAMTCSKPRIGEFGGGWCAIFADRVEIETTAEPLAEALTTEPV